MAVGDLKGGPFELVYAPIGSGSPVAGDIVAFDTDGDIIVGSATTLGRHGIMTALTHVVGATTYYGVCVKGKCVCTAGGAIKKNAYVQSDANQDAVDAPETVSTTVLQAEVRVLWRVLGQFLWKEGDNQYDPADAAATDAIVVDVGATP